MRKKIVAAQPSGPDDGRAGWLDLANLAQVEITSEDPSHPIESALQPDIGSGWRAAEPGPQVIRLLFDQPLAIRRVYLRVEERERNRSQEFVLRWSRDYGRSYREVVRQQYHFAPPGTVSEQEEYTVNLSGVTTLELEIIPDLGDRGAIASLAGLRLA